jgi:hypothetical protein
VLFSFAVLVSLGCFLYTTPDDVSLLLIVCNCSNSAKILYSFFRGRNTPEISRGVVAVGPDMTKVLAVVKLHKVSLNIDEKYG